jgi:class 3 adenylate cyclase
MTASERKLLWHSIALGAVLIGVVVMLDCAGYLDGPERLLNDLRMRHNQRFNAPPTDRIVHVDIDDATLDVVGAWPWPRTKLALMTDEMHRAGARAIAFDILFTEPQSPRLPEAFDQVYQLRQGLENQDNAARTLIDDDLNFARSTEQAGNVHLAVAFTTYEPPSPSEQTIITTLLKDPEQSTPQIVEALRARGFATDALDLTDESMIRWKKRALFDRILAELAKGEPPFDDPGTTVHDAVNALRERILPGQGALTTPLVRILQREYPRARSVRDIEGLSRRMDETTPPLRRMQYDFPPLPQLSRVIAGGGFVNYLPEVDGIVRRVPLLIKEGPHIYSQLGLLLACHQIGVDPKELQITEDAVTLPRKGQPDIRIPVHTETTDDQQTATVIHIPFFGGAEWETMYDPHQKDRRQQLPMVKIWEIIETEIRIHENNRLADDALGSLWTLLDPDRLKEIEANPLPINDVPRRLSRIDEAIKEAEDWYDALKGIPREEWNAYLAELPDDTERQNHHLFIAAYEALPHIRDQAPQLVEQAAMMRADLHKLLNENSVLVGWTSTGRMDMYATPLHPIFPGAMAHGVVFNAIMNGEFLRRAPEWIAYVLSIIFGLVTTLCVVSLSPLKSGFFALALALGYFALNGIILFDYLNAIVDIAAPLATVGTVWSITTLYRFVVEIAERARITSRFRSYVDPVLVDYVIESEDPVTEGKVQELTVVFTDLAGFTSISEKLQEKTVNLLSEYLEQMVPIIRAHHGYVNKFLGDGIMFFYGAPRPNTNHGPDAVVTALEMCARLKEFNETLVMRDLPEVAMRVGINSGNMVVGDSGPLDASDYTVLGDAVNLSARLESANKATGTSIMMGQRTYELCNGQVLARPVAKLQVVGKTQGVMTYEALALVSQATDAQHRLVEMTWSFVKPFQAGQLDAAITAIDTFDAEFGDSKLSALYRKTCEQLLETGAPDDFTGEIVLETK